MDSKQNITLDLKGDDIISEQCSKTGDEEMICTLLLADAPEFVSKSSRDVHRLNSKTSTSNKREKNSKHFRDLPRVIYNYLKFENRCHRQNFIQTMCVYFNFVLLGWNYGQLGTAFHDLQLVLNITVKQTTLIFTMNSMGYMAGSLGIGFVYDRMDKLLLLGLVSIASAIASAVIPWCTDYGVFLALRLLTGFLCGGLDAGGNAKVASCWGTGGAQYMQALHFSYAFGGIISPLVTSLFMAPRLSINGTMNNETYDEKWENHSSNITSAELYPTDLESIGNQDFQVLYEESKIHIAFLITGILTAFAGCGYLLLYCLGYKKVYSFYSGKTQGQSSQMNSQYKSKDYPRLNKVQTIVFIVTLATSIISFSAVECKYQSFLMPFMLMQMHWTKYQCAYAISLLWAFYGIGRFLGIPISRILSPLRILICYMCFSLFLSFMMFVGAKFHVDTLIWITVPLSGLSISLIFPSFIVWTDENVMQITGKMAGYFLFVGAVGFLIDPLYIGALMENISPMSFVYLQMGEMSLSLLVFIILVLWVNSLHSDPPVKKVQQTTFKTTL